MEAYHGGEHAASIALSAPSSPMPDPKLVLQPISTSAYSKREGERDGGKKGFDRFGTTGEAFHRN